MIYLITTCSLVLAGVTMGIIDGMKNGRRIKCQRLVQK